jgi:predicted aspartyl protease
MVDTGTDPSVVDLALARKLRLGLAHGGSGTGGGSGKSLVFQTSIPQLSVGGLGVRNVDALAIDMSRQSRKLGVSIGGVLGYSFLEGRVTQFDYTHAVLIVGDASDRSDGTTVLPFRLDSDNGVIIDVLVNGKRAVADLDTGSNGALAVTPKAIRALGLTQSARFGTPISGLGYNGTYRATKGFVDRLQLGDTEIAHVPTTFWPPKSGHDATPWQVNVGNRLLRRFDPIFDYRRKLVYLRRQPSR